MPVLSTRERKLTEAYIDLAKKIAQLSVEYFSYRYPYDELQSVAFVALSEASRTYDDERDTSFAAYARKAIRNKTIDYVNAEKKRVVECSITAYSDYTLDAEDFEEPSFFGVEDQAYELVEIKITLGALMKRLPKKRDKHLLGLRLQQLEDGRSLTQEEMAQKMTEHFGIPISQATVHNRLKHIYEVYKSLDN